MNKVIEKVCGYTRLFVKALYKYKLFFKTFLIGTKHFLKEKESQ